MIDDTDGVDEEGEFKAWELREMKRLKRARDKANMREEQAKDTARRRALTDAEREAEDAILVQEGVRKDGDKIIKRANKGMFYMDDDAMEGSSDVRLREAEGETQDDRLRAMERAIRKSRDADRAQAQGKRSRRETRDV
ncbi:Microfibrillar-associated protein 1 [Hondaea fermentalgiana]|uniref:Microfibrillar-associated protein 1 n=1 Tax=Hondaea fermentalgiana TaxID=2315210 RepID=A0A2R5GH89_9STRA|nr:Microfibrillar-associated protein 1 [Hondaea fermentalgiana]|eukprot:GBG30262.1 Microfibrillar-associated protein 1 [Hondaea fermentalgiana]